MIRRSLLAASIAAVTTLSGCQPAPPPSEPTQTAATEAPSTNSTAADRVNDYAEVTLTADLSHLSEGDQAALVKLIEASKLMDQLFWRQVWGDPEELLGKISDPATRRLVEINYGPWDTLNDHAPFVEGIGPRPAGARFYPSDMSKEEFEAADLPGKTSQYSLIRRNQAGELISLPYSEAFKAELEQAAGLLREAASTVSDDGFKQYLQLRAEALLSNEYQASDMAWMDMKSSPIDVVIGPIETYQDALFGYRAAFEAFVLVKDIAWSERLARFAQHLPALQRDLPVDPAYKTETPGTDADLNAYFAIYYAGDANAGAKTIAINLPNDEQVQLAKGSRRLQLENVMRAKFDSILRPIATELIDPAQQAHITFDAFFENVMFHEVAHGLGIKNTINGKGTVREALTDLAGSFEEGKADILGLYMIGKLGEMGELDAARLEDNYVTFLAGIFRSVRFGAGSAHGQANMVAFNYLAERGAFSRDEASGRYRVDFQKMGEAVDSLSSEILTLQGDGNYEGAKALNAELGVIRPTLAGDLARLEAADIPVDIVFRQGLDVLNLGAQRSP
ncbi:dipeptidyl-peptidase 3 family protein [Pseudomarimonas arenosa]|uniref:Zn-dependent hydrolase n=1 Tax=Pseudomarimonas arenosa TaxID=2774145 RepID=A0AAW3ZF00_9GAMM|nr:Zn-dependent hydrolase [Pseudomarimonas arenosa]MBD8524483.1 Zn-dependent hydrolase [Pseudomarimonas arenosa]